MPETAAAGTPTPEQIAAALAAVPVASPALSTVTLRDPVFISDLHLCAARPRTVAGFHALLDGLAQTGLPDLVILGDLFEFWAGDDTLVPSATAQDDDAISIRAAAALRAYGERGGRVFVMHGNRDLLLGRAFCQASGAQRLQDPCVATFEGNAATLGMVLLSHGDAYCTLDTAYQAFRQQARQPQFQAMFLSRSLPERRAVLGQARQQSEAAKQQAELAIMDVTPQAIETALVQAGMRAMIHGHTHRPARHALSVQGEAAWRWVLTDWDLDQTDRPRAGGLQVLDGQLSEFTLKPGYDD
jgi:UDP-2,3-diacylglucosamine hydrolase